jgi:hypothetical protein
MGNHVRQQIRERVALTLTGLTTTGSNVFQSRVYPVQKSELPCLCIYSTDESSRIAELGNSDRMISRNLTIRIDGIAVATSNLDDTLDTISLEVETAMANDLNINNLAVDSALSSTRIDLNGDGEQPVGVVSMLYNITYFNRENDPDTAY